MNPDRDADKKDDGPPASPYGPQPRGTDEAAGGADSSPHEAESTDERKPAAETERRQGRTPGTANESP